MNRKTPTTIVLVPCSFYKVTAYNTWNNNSYSLALAAMYDIDGTLFSKYYSICNRKPLCPLLCGSTGWLTTISRSRICGLWEVIGITSRQKQRGKATRLSDNGITLSPSIYYLLDRNKGHPTYSVFWYFTLDDPNHVIFFAGLVQEVKVKSCP